MQQSKESDESVETVRERFSFTWRRNDFLLVFTLLEMRIVKKKRTKQKTNVKKKRPGLSDQITPSKKAMKFFDKVYESK